jgi:tripartite-type tricarboxylate transporter receptor subunit TctC
MKRAFVLVFVLTISMFYGAVIVRSADFPTRPITIINPMSPGGSRDIMARTFASVAEKLLGQPIVVVNKPGASGMIGGLAGAQAVPDGYTLTVTSTGDTCAVEWERASGRKLLYSMQDFVALGSFTLGPALVVVPPNSPWKTLGDMIKDCKAKPGHYAFASGGMYGIVHIAEEILMQATGIKARNVPYQGGAPALNAVVGGHVDFSTQFVSTSIPLARGNKLRILAVMDNERVKSIPDVPTAKELGVDAKAYIMVGLLAPKKTPAPVVQKLRDVLGKVVKDKTFVDVVTGLGEEVNYLDGDGLTKYIEQESAQIGKIMTDLAKEESKK